jgi:hypothetical protein
VFSASGSASFTTIANTDDVALLAQEIKLNGVPVIQAPGTYSTTFGTLHFSVIGVIPEPSSLVLLGIGMAGLLASGRLLRGRRPVVEAAGPGERV